jgi:hypothetical protein
MRRTLTTSRGRDLAPGVRNLLRRTSLLRRSGSTRPTTVLYVVPERDGGKAWQPGSGNHSFDLVESAREYLTSEQVHTVEITEGEIDWASRVAKEAVSVGATHVIGHVEHDPAGSHEWTWDSCIRDLRAAWSGTFVAISYDSAYPYASMLLDRLARMYDDTVVMAIDRPLTGLIRPRHACAGPAFLPVPTSSINALDALTAGIEPVHDLTFIGNVDGYPYRSDSLAALRAAGLEVAVNPHIVQGESRPGFASYAGALKSSRITINFSRCNGEPITQLKTRIMEGSLFGTVVATDSDLYASPYFTPGKHFLAYSSPEDLHRQVTALLADPSALDAMREQARMRAIEIAPFCFWENLDATLSVRELPRLRAI